MKKLYLATAAIIASVPAVFATSDIEPVTVVKGPNGPVRISRSQFNPAQHEMHVADEHHDEHGVARSNASQPMSAPIALANAPAAQSTAPIAPAARQFGVLQNKGKFYVVDSKDGSTVNDVPAFDPKGYSDNASAWGAITAAALAPASDNGGKSA